MNFTARKATEENTTLLHAEIAKREFLKQSNKMESFTKLPTAEYHRTGDELTRKRVLEDAKSVAKAVWAECSVLVAETELPKLHWNFKKAK